ncbi:MAG: hypothetical protein JNM62_05920 [Flavobacteriales bacterium]|nr:hypothetical protein [Flavobacteriales bacterium]
MRRIALIPATALFSITLNAQLPNAGFESSVTVEEDIFPAEWSSPTEFGFGSMTDAHSGNYSLGVWTWYWYAEGQATNGNTAWPLPGGTPVQGRPIALAGWFKRMGGELQDGFDNDAHIHVELTRWNTLTDQRDTVASGHQAFGEQEAWEPFSIALSSTSTEAPDSITVRMTSCGNCLCAGSSDGTCAYFLVDDLETVYATGLPVPLGYPQASAGLSPSSHGHVRVHLSDPADVPLQLRLWDATGRMIVDVTITRNAQEVDLRGHQGLLTYTFTSTTGTSIAGRCMMP